MLFVSPNVYEKYHYEIGLSVCEYALKHKGGTYIQQTLVILWLLLLILLFVCMGALKYYIIALWWGGVWPQLMILIEYVFSKYVCA